MALRDKRDYILLSHPLSHICRVRQVAPNKSIRTDPNSTLKRLGSTLLALLLEFLTLVLNRFEAAETCGVSLSPSQRLWVKPFAAPACASRTSAMKHGEMMWNTVKCWICPHELWLLVLPPLWTRKNNTVGWPKLLCKVGNKQRAGLF